MLIGGFCWPKERFASFFHAKLTGCTNISEHEREFLKCCTAPLGINLFSPA